MDSLLLLIVSIATAYCNIVTPGKVQPFLNQTSFGVYRYKGWRLCGVQFKAHWLQDDNEQKLALGIGERDKDLQAHFCFFCSNAYELKPVDHQDQSKGYNCFEYMDFNYTMEVSAYDNRHLKSIGRKTIKEGNVTAEFFMGVALDVIGPLNVVVATDTSDGTFVKIYATQMISEAAYSEFYLNERTDYVPDAKYFKLPAECTDQNNPPEQVYFFKKFNMKGEKIEPIPNTATKQNFNVSLFVVLTTIALVLIQDL